MGSEKICVLGLGYIGLPTATILASRGFDVIGVDNNPRVVDLLSKGELHIEEPGLRMLVQASRGSGNLKVQSEPEEASTFIIAVHTPLDGEKADLRYVKSASEAIVPHLRRGNLVILESTVPPGTTAKFVGGILETSGLKAGEDFLLAHCPERVLPGRILHELTENDRVIGGISTESAERAKRLYESFANGQIFTTNATTAEMVKNVENIYRDVNIALANELSRICSQLGINIWEVIELGNKHPRTNIHTPGVGVGGHCLPIDPWFVIQNAPEHAQLIELSRRINDAQPQYVFSIITEMLRNIDSPVVSVLGVTYKPNVDDTRGSPSLDLIKLLIAQGIDVKAHDPHAISFSHELLELDETIGDTDCLIIAVMHDEFLELKPNKLKTLMRTPQVFSTSAAIDRIQYEQEGVSVRILGDGKGV